MPLCAVKQWMHRILTRSVPLKLFLRRTSRCRVKITLTSDHGNTLTSGICCSRDGRHLKLIDRNGDRTVCHKLFWMNSIIRADGFEESAVIRDDPADRTFPLVLMSSRYAGLAFSKHCNRFYGGHSHASVTIPSQDSGFLQSVFHLRHLLHSSG